jgi:DNA-binding NarL/FixJ family response regulator
MWQQGSIRIYVVESDIYARQSIASYLSWDRRTRVVGVAATPHEMLADLTASAGDRFLDALTLNADAAPDAAGLVALIRALRHRLPDANIICLSTHPDPELAVAARQAGARAFLSREAVGLGIAGAVCFALEHRFVVTEDIAARLDAHQAWEVDATPLPCRRHYERLTPRIEQALWLCVVEGLPAELAAEEMGVSTSTVRSYIKEGYRILEEEDDTRYPAAISPAERAFLRFTALAAPLELPRQWRPAA